MTHRRSMSNRRAPRQKCGFTLLEVLVSFSIIAVATGILFSLFLHSVRIDKDTRGMKVAANLARERLVDIQRNPGGYLWPKAEALASGEAAVVSPRQGADHVPLAPSALPAHEASGRHEQDFYEGFKMTTFAKGPVDEGYVEVTVVVEWINAGETQDIALTASVPRVMVEEAA